MREPDSADASAGQSHCAVSPAAGRVPETDPAGSAGPGRDSAPIPRGSRTGRSGRDAEIGLRFRTPIALDRDTRREESGLGRRSSNAQEQTRPGDGKFLPKPSNRAQRAVCTPPNGAGADGVLFPGSGAPSPTRPESWGESASCSAQRPGCTRAAGRTSRALSPGACARGRAGT